MYTSRMFDMWSTVTSKLESHTPVQTNVQATSVQSQSSGSIKGKFIQISFYSHQIKFYIQFIK